MNNLEKYNQVFCEVFSLKSNFDKESIELNVTADWDSVGHMELIARLEETFEIMLEVDDILGLTSYVNGIEILKKYRIEI